MKSVEKKYSEKEYKSKESLFYIMNSYGSADMHREEETVESGKDQELQEIVQIPPEGCITEEVVITNIKENLLVVIYYCLQPQV